MTRFDRYLIGFVLAHFLVVLLHSVSHLVLAIVPAIPDVAFIVSVIIAGPLLPLAVLRSNRAVATGVLALVMGAAFVYGFVGHFLVAGPDHVSASVSDPWTAVFVVSAALLGALEAVSVVFAVTAFRAAVRTPSESAGPSA